MQTQRLSIFGGASDPAEHREFGLSAASLPPVMRKAAYLERIDHSLKTRFLTSDIRFDILSCHRTIVSDPGTIMLLDFAQPSMSRRGGAHARRRAREPRADAPLN